jgi:drug/metabolite transporter (DMT)-like permease
MASTAEPSNGRDNTARFLLILTMAIWGSNAVAGRYAVGEISPMALVMFRWIGVMLLVLFFARGKLRADWPLLRRRLPFVMLLGGLGFAGFNAFFYAAATATQAINIGILQGSIPVIVLLGGYLMFQSNVSPTQIAGVAVTVVGVVVLASQGSWNNLISFSFNEGDLLMLCACVLYAGYTLALVRRPAVSGLAMFAVMAAAALLVSIPLALAEFLLGAFQWPTLTGWAIVGFVAIFPSFLAQLFFLRSVDLIGPGRSGVFVNLVPVFAAALGVLVLQESFELFHGLSLALVLGGVLLAERSAQSQ